MTKLEQKLVDLLKRLKESYHVIGVKAELEAEGTRREELMRLKDVIDKVGGLTFTVKIGGCEAVTDLYDAILFGASHIVAPMIESGYAMSKFLGIVKYNVADDIRKTTHFGINLETIYGYQNLQDILKTPGIEMIDFITVGRVDLSGSMGIARDQINCEKIFQITSDVYTQVKKHKMETALGGGIAKEALPFIKRLSNKLLDRFETRKIVFAMPSNFRKAEEGIIKANEFEVMWLENKREYYGRIFREDEKRIEMIRKRLKK